jgi:hypothetical protein
MVIYNVTVHLQMSLNICHVGIPDVARGGIVRDLGATLRREYRNPSHRPTLCMITPVLCSRKTFDDVVPCDIRALICSCLWVVSSRLVTGLQRLNCKEYISVAGKLWFSSTPLFPRGNCNCEVLTFPVPTSSCVYWSVKFVRFIYRWVRVYIEVLNLCVLFLWLYAKSVWLLISGVKITISSVHEIVVKGKWLQYVNYCELLLSPFWLLHMA